MKSLAYLLIPHSRNNFRAKVIQPSGLLFIVLIFLILYIAHVPTHVSKILGYTADRLPAEKIIEITNSKREANGLPPLRVDQSLTEAAKNKGIDMLNNDYWAHVSPSGTTPWYFFDGVKYEYRYAGENLARDFDSPENVVNAWMDSPTHKKNLLSEKYDEIGIAVVEGELDGRATTLVVQFFGARPGSYLARSTSIESGENTVQSPQSLTKSYSVSEFKLQRGLALFVVGILLLVFLLDALFMWNKKIIRISGRTLAHLSFLASIGLILFMVNQGDIL